MAGISPINSEAFQQKLGIQPKNFRIHSDKSIKSLSNTDWENTENAQLSLEESIQKIETFIPKLPQFTQSIPVESHADLLKRYIPNQNELAFEESTYNAHHSGLIFEQLSELFKLQIHSVFKVNPVSQRYRSTKPKKKSPNTTTLISQITVPEIILFYELITQNWGNTPITMLLTITQKSPLILKMQIYQHQSRIKIYHFRYDDQFLNTKIIDETGEVGKLRFIIRNDYLEEIEGEFKGKPLVLDPIWATKAQKTSLREESIIIGDFRTTLVKDRSTLHSTFQLDKHPTKIIMTEQLKQLHNTLWQSTKKMVLNNFYGEGKAIFTKDILLPVSAQYIFQKITK
jgi:hypothetical protein